MTDRRFRFGVVAAAVGPGTAWAETVKWVENAGFSTLLSPDAYGAGSPVPALGAAAMASTSLRLGTFVLAVPLRRPAAIAWEAATIDRLSGGRFELGVGAGRPDAAREAEVLGVPWGSPGERVAQVADAIREVRGLFDQATASAAPGQLFAPLGGFAPQQRPTPPVMVAGNGPKLLKVAAEQADIVSFGLSANPTEEALAERVALTRALAGDRFDDLELNLNVFAVGDEIAPWMTSQFGVDPSRAKDNQDVRVLNGDVDTIADVLRRRRDTFGLSYVLVNQFAAEKFAPVVELLTGT